jgi:hypothetical protein
MKLSPTATPFVWDSGKYEGLMVRFFFPASFRGGGWFNFSKVICERAQNSDIANIDKKKYLVPAVSFEGVKTGVIA